MPTYFFERFHDSKKLIIEAKSEAAARIYLTREWACEVIAAKRMTQLVLDGVGVESANADPLKEQREADEAALRG